MFRAVSYTAATSKQKQVIMRRMLVLIALIAATATFAVPSIPPAFAQVSGTSSTSTYVVQVGDNLFRIALRYGVSVNQIAVLNGIVNPNLIFVGQTLQIPAGGTIS